MSEFEDFKLDSQTREVEPLPPEIEGDRRRRILVVSAVVIAVLLAGVLAWWLMRRQSRQSAEAPPPTPAVTEAQEEAAPLEVEVTLPELSASDAWVREVVEQLSSHPGLTQWLVTDDLVRRFTAAVDNVAEGTSAKTHVPFLRPDGSFSAEQRNGRFYVDPASYRRHDRTAAIVDSLHVDGTADLYRRVRPLIDEAWAELGYPDRVFEPVLVRAVKRMLSVPVIGGPIELEAGVSSYRYADPRLEALGPVEKQLLRLGPDNLRIVQAKIRSVARAAGLAVD